MSTSCIYYGRYHFIIQKEVPLNHLYNNFISSKQYILINSLINYYFYIFIKQGDAHSSFEPRKIEGLCQKNVMDISFGSGPHVVAVTKGESFFFQGHLLDLK